MSTSTPTKRPLTPITGKKEDYKPSTPVTGTWTHPQMDEIIKRQDASKFTDRNMSVLLYNLGAVVTVWILGKSLWNYLPNFILNISSLDLYGTWAYYLLTCVFLYNIFEALRPLFRAPDPIQDIPLTPAQRQILGLPLSDKPETEEREKKYVTPPRYSRTPTSASGSSPASMKGTGSSPLSRRGSPLGRSVSGSPFSPGASPLLQKGRGGGMRSSSFGSPSPLGPGGSKINLPEMPGTPSPAAKQPSVGLNSKYLYDKMRRNSGNTMPFS